MAPTGIPVPGGDNANRCAQAGIIPSVLQVCTQPTGIYVRTKNTRPSWWLIYFIARDRQGFPPPPLFIKLGHLVTFASWLKPQQSQENSFPMRRSGRRRKGKRKEQKKKKKQAKGVLWDQWCKKLFLLSAAWLTFPADTDKRMGGARRPVCWCRVSWVNESEGGKKINEIIDVTCQI